MGSLTAYQCDGPGCNVLTTRTAGVRYPEQWVRLTLHLGPTQVNPSEKVSSMIVSGSFHSAGCAHRWLDRFDEEFGGGVEAEA